MLVGLYHTNLKVGMALAKSAILYSPSMNIITCTLIDQWNIGIIGDRHWKTYQCYSVWTPQSHHMISDLVSPLIALSIVIHKAKQSCVRLKCQVCVKTFCIDTINFDTISGKFFLQVLELIHYFIECRKASTIAWNRVHLLAPVLFNIVCTTTTTTTNIYWMYTFATVGNGEMVQRRIWPITSHHTPHNIVKWTTWPSCALWC